MIRIEIIDDSRILPDDGLADAIEAVETSTFDAHVAAQAGRALIKAGLARATDGGVILSRSEVDAISFILGLIEGRTLAANDAAGALALRYKI